MHFHCDSRCREYSLLFTVMDCQLVNVRVCFLFCDQLRNSMNISTTIIMFRDKNKKEAWFTTAQQYCTRDLLIKCISYWKIVSRLICKRSILQAAYWSSPKWVKKVVSDLSCKRSIYRKALFSKKDQKTHNSLTFSRKLNWKRLSFLLWLSCVLRESWSWALSKWQSSDQKVGSVSDGQRVPEQGVA